MNEVLETFWNEFFAEKCAAIDTEKERYLTKKAAKMHEAINELLSPNQRNDIEEYIDVLCEMQEEFVKKAFFKGCRFATAFLLGDIP